MVVAGAVAIAAVAVELGGAVAVNRALDDAGARRQARQYPDAIAAYRAAAARSGPLYLLAGAAIADAAGDAERTTLEWAAVLAAANRVDEALAVADRVTDPALAEAARQERALIALAGARAAAAAGQDETALQRLDRLLAGSPPPALAAAGAQLRPGIEVAAAAQLLDGGRAADAVASLDDALRGNPAAAVAARARALLPAALLGAGKERAAAGDPQQAQSFLRRCSEGFAGTPPGSAAAVLLRAPQPVTGTLVRSRGTPLAGVLVRLAGGYRRTASSFTLAGPFYSARTGGDGSFRIAHVPVGAVLVFEFLDTQGWELIVDDTRAPAYTAQVQPLTPSDLGFVREP